MNTTYYNFSCGHRGIEAKDPEFGDTLTRSVDTDCPSCQKAEILQRAKEYAKKVDSLTEEEWNTHENAFLERQTTISQEHPEWTTDAVSREAEIQRQQAEANEQKKTLAVPELILHPVLDSGGQSIDHPPEWVEGENDEIVEDFLHPIHANVIFQWRKQDEEEEQRKRVAYDKFIEQAKKDLEDAQSVVFDAIGLLQLE